MRTTCTASITQRYHLQHFVLTTVQYPDRWPVVDVKLVEVVLLLHQSVVIVSLVKRKLVEYAVSEEELQLHMRGDDPFHFCN